MDERKQYVPTALRTYPAENNTIGIKPETIVREAANKKTNYKNLNETPVETNEATINSKIQAEQQNK